jgi:hypothetical protein
MLNVLDLGARNDGQGSSATTAAFQSAFQIAAQGQIRVPAGRYSIDNSAGPLQVRGFSGELLFEGGASLEFTNSQNGGIWFTGGTGARIRGLHVTYATAPAIRNSPQEAVKFSGTADTLLTDSWIERSPAAGILFYDSIRPRVTNATIQNTLADGLHFANSQDAQVTGLNTLNTGDDGLAFVNYSQNPNRNGGTATNIIVRQSHARGITVVGTSDVVITNFVIDGTSSSGLLCGQDQLYNTRSPDRVQFSSGVIRNAGTVLPLVGNNYGIEFNSQKKCSFSDIEISEPAGRGVGGLAPEGSVRVENVRVRGNLKGEGFSFVRTASVEVSGSVAENSPSYGFFFGQNARVVVKGITAINSSTANSLGRAIWFENNECVVGSDMTVVDDQASPTGYIVGGFQDSEVIQRGTANGISASIDHGSLKVQNTSAIVFSGIAQW